MDRRQQLMVTRIVWGALCLGPAIFAIVVQTAIVSSTPAADADTARVVLFVVAALAAVGLAVSRLLPKRIKPSQGMSVEMAHRTRVIIGSAICEGVSLFAVVGYLITHDRNVLLIGAVPYLGLLTLFPTEEQIEALERESREGPTA